MSTLDDAREGMDPDVRPQDDLFGHVNGRWLETVEIPPDLPMVGGFVSLALEAEAQVDQILRDAAAAASTGEAERSSAQQLIGDLYTSFLDEATVERLGGAPLAGLLAQVATISSTAEFAEVLGSF